MTLTLLLILSLTIAGIPIASALRPSARGATLAAESFLLACGWSAYSLLFMSVVHIRWSLPLAVAVILALPAVLMVMQRRRDVPAAASGPPRIPPSRVAVVIAATFDVLSLLILVSYARFATVARVWEWDFWAIWGLKARQFLEIGGVDWAFLSRPENLPFHPNYPLLPTLVFDLDALVHGQWSDRWLGLFSPAFAIAAVLAVRAIARREFRSPVIVALVTFATANTASSPYIGLAEVFLISYGAVAVLLIRHGLLFRDDQSLTAGAVFLGLTSFTKDEGFSLAVAALAALLLASPQKLRVTRRIWPAPAIALVWFVLVRVHHLQLDLTSGNLSARLLPRLESPGLFFGALMQVPAIHAVFWGMFIVALLVCYRTLVRREPFLFLTLSLQVAFDLAAYYVTPHTLYWHVLSSWPRLIFQVMILACYLAVALLATRLEPEETPLLTEVPA